MQVMDKKLLSSRAGTRFAEGDPPLSLAEWSPQPWEIHRVSSRNSLNCAQKTEGEKLSKQMQLRQFIFHAQIENGEVVEAR